MNIIIFGVLAGIAIVSLVLAYMYGSVAFGTVSGILFLIVGGSVLIGGLDVAVGEVSTTTITGTITETQYADLPVFGWAIGLTLMLLAVYMFLSSYETYKLDKQGGEINARGSRR